MPLPTVTLADRHVRLEPLEPRHVDELWSAASERQIWAYMPLDVASRDDLGRWADGRLRDFAQGTALPFLQRDPATGVAFGSTSLFDIDLPNRRMEIGHTWIGRSHRRTPANTEAKRLLMGYAFETMKAVRVQLKTDERNVRSQTAIARIGAVREGVLRNHMIMPDGHLRNTVMFSVTHQEWPAVKRRLDELLARPAPNLGKLP